MTPGIVSVSFRNKTCQELIAMTAQAGLKSIEWGGDIHVPHGDISQAKHVQTMCSDAGISCAAYGSYYRCDPSVPEAPDARAVVETAAALGAPVIRVWAGNQHSVDASEDYKKNIAENAVAIADLADKYGIRIAFEYHMRTLTDCDASTRELMTLAAHPNLYYLWQPINGATTEVCLESLKTVMPRLLNIHVFHWPVDQDGVRYRVSLNEGKERWSGFLGWVQAQEPTPAFERHCLLEFIRNDDPKQFFEDAQVLQDILNGLKK